MALPDIDVLIQRAKEVVQEGEVDELNLESIYEQLEEEHHLKKGSLTRDYKKRLKSEIESVTVGVLTKGDGSGGEQDDDDDEDEGEAEDDSREIDSGARPTSKGRKRTASTSKPSAKDNKKKPKTPRASKSGEKAKKQPATKADANRKPREKQYLSKEFVDTEDEDEEVSPPTTKPAATAPVASSSKPAKQPVKKSSPKKVSPKKALAPPSSRKSGEDKTPQTKSKPASAVKISKKAQSASKDNVKDDSADDSAESDIDDKPPAKRRKTKESTSNKPEPKKRPQKGPDSTADKDEAQIKKLKSLVLGCGVRKVWVKEFKGLDTPSQQITRLRDILTGLGMTGRFSMEQAKAIKTKRELAQELQDVQAFDEAINSRSSRSKSAAAAANSSKKRPRDDDDDDSGDAEGPRTRQSAKSRIAAFLADQSDDDE